MRLGSLSLAPRTTATAPILALVLLGLAGPASGTDEACAEASTTAQMIDCAAARFEAADRELNQTYQALMAKLDPEQRAALRTAQRAWITFRNAEARFAGSAAAGGSLAGVIELGEKAALTESRIAALRRAVE